MKLQNKKTGEIKDICEVLDMKQEDGVLYKYCSLDELNEEWQDYETREGFKQFIKFNKCFVVGFYDEESSTKELEKAKAWQRLKDKGFRFISLYGGSMSIDYTLEGKVDDKVMEDLKLLFNGIRGEE